MRKQIIAMPVKFMYLALNCILAAVVSGLLTAMTLAGIVLLLSSYTLAA